MLGYVRPFAPELRLRELQYYRGVYCGLCRAMGRCTGQCSRFTLSYDLVFLALVRLALNNGNTCQGQADRIVRFEKRRCLVHPLRRRLSLEHGDSTDYAARVSALLNYYKLLDDRTDESGGARLRATLLLPTFRRFFRRAQQHVPELSEDVARHMQSLNVLEQDTIPSADEPADAFGQALACTFSHGLAESVAPIAHHIGYHIGRWLYYVDAIDDYGEDIKRGRPNALYRLYGEQELSEQHRKDLYYALLKELRQASDALDLITIDPDRCGKELSPLLYHMAEIALPEVTRRVIFPDTTKAKRQKQKVSDLHDGSL
jgi:hypothetical protein